MAFADKTLTCRDCGMEFTFTAGEQEFYQSRGLRNEPGRCPTCRGARRQSRYGGYPRSGRETYTVICAACGQEAEVPFRPTGDRPVYCNECFTRMRSSS